MFPCESCGHPLAHHNPCNVIVGSGKKAKLCACTPFEPAELQARAASLTDIERPSPSALAALLPKGGGR